MEACGNFLNFSPLEVHRFKKASIMSNIFLFCTVSIQGAPTKMKAIEIVIKIHYVSFQEVFKRIGNCYDIEIFTLLSPGLIPVCETYCLRLISCEL